jgi:hypothetical protein
MKRHRSPTTATKELVKAMKICKTLYAVFENGFATSETLVKAMGYSNLNGPAGSVIATLKEYGLIVSIDPCRERLKNAQYQLSDVAIKALNERPLSFQLAKKLILTCSLNQKLYNVFQENLPDDEKIIDEIMSQNFQEKTAKHLVRIVRKNWQLLQPKIEKTDSSSLEYKLPALRLFKDCEARVSFNAPITSEAVEKLIKHLELCRGLYD